MTVPQWVLLAFAGWTLALLTATVGVYRWHAIFTGRTRIAEWQADAPLGNDWYRRATRAHVNCIENLPVYGTVVFCATAVGLDNPVMDALAIAVMAGRICQTLVHVAFAPSDLIGTLRFAGYLVQAASKVTMGILVALAAAHPH